jgi:alpha-L-fucosidase 2
MVLRKRIEFSTGLSTDVRGIFFRLLPFPALCLLFAMSTISFSQPAAAQRPIHGLERFDATPLTLWYGTPARNWTDALAIGNGRLGAMLFGDPESDRFQLNDITVWSGGPMPKADRAGAYEALPAIRDALKKGDYAKAQSLVRSNMTTTGEGDSEYWPSYETLGDLRFQHKLGGGNVSNYVRWLNIESAVSGVDFQVGGVTYHRETFSSAPDHAIVTHLTSDHPGAISFALQLSRIASATTTVQGNDTLIMRGDSTFPAQPARPPITTGPRAGFPGSRAQEAKDARPGNLDYEVQVRIRATGGVVKREGNELVVEGADQVTVVLVAGTSYILNFEKNYKGDDPHAQVTAQLQGVAGKSYEELKMAHIADYQRFFNRVRFNLPVTEASKQQTDLRIKNYEDGNADPSLAVLYYQMGRYFLISSSREDNPLPSNSQGIWGDGLDLPWKCDYKSNINYQMNYWPSETANLSELHMPAIRFDADLVKPGTKTARTYYNSPGWVVAYTANAWGWTSPGAGLPWGPFFGGGGWLVQDIWEHYAFSRDRDFLRTYYPVLKGSAEFYLSILVPDANGKLITSPSLSPENTFKTDDGVIASVVDGSAVEREIIWDLFTNTIAASKVLDTDHEFRVKLEAAKAAIRPLEIGKAGQLEEWGHDWDLNAPEINHRHISHLFAAYPGWQISPDTTPELAAAVKKSLALRGDEATGWSNAWKINLYARLKDGDHALKILNEQLRLAGSVGTDYHGEGGGTYGNMMDAHPPFQIDGNFGSTSGIDEMLLQSSQRYTDDSDKDKDLYVIELLPALPSKWPNGSMHGLRARGGFEVDVDWSDGKLSSAKILSVGGSSAKLKSLGQTIAIRMSPGEELRLTAPNGIIHQVSTPGFTDAPVKRGQ